MPKQSFDVEVVRASFGTATIHVPDAIDLQDAQRKAVDAAGDVIFTTRHAEYEPVNGWARTAVDTQTAPETTTKQGTMVYLLMKTSLGEEHWGEGLPVAVLVKVTDKTLPALVTQLAQNGRDTAGLQIDPSDYRWLKSVAFTPDNRLASVEGFFDSNAGTVVYLNEAQLIDETENNDGDLLAPTCEVHPAPSGCSQVLRIKRFLNDEDLRIYFADNFGEEGQWRLSTFADPVAGVLREIDEAMGKPRQSEHLAAFTEIILSSNAMLRALLTENELVERHEGESASAYINRLIADDFEAGADGFFSSVYARTMPALDEATQSSHAPNG